jgi:hypothetical protein
LTPPDKRFCTPAQAGSRPQDPLFKARIDAISDQLFTLIGDIRLNQPIEDKARLSALSEWHKAQLAALVADVATAEAVRTLGQIRHVFESREP